MTFAARRRPIRKDMPQVTPASCADLFNPNQSITRVTHSADVALVIRAKETRPTSSRIKLRARSEKRQPAKAAAVDALFVIVEKHPTKGGFRTVIEQHIALGLAQAGNNRGALRRSGRCQIKFSHLVLLGDSIGHFGIILRSVGLADKPPLRRHQEPRRACRERSYLARTFTEDLLGVTALCSQRELSRGWQGACRRNLKDCWSPSERSLQARGACARRRCSGNAHNIWANQTLKNPG